MSSIGERINLFKTALILSRFYPKPILDKNIIVNAPINDVPAQIHVLNQNCITTLRELTQKYDRCIMLNMANYITPGGGVTVGAKAQEEFLCRISNLYPALMKAKDQGWYPLVDGFKVKEVTFFRDENYLDMEPFQSDVVTISAPMFNAVYEVLKPEQLQHIVTRIKQLIELCLGYDALVLSAFGCGAFNNPPEVVAQVFKEVLINGGMAKHFKEIVFAIIEDHNSAGKNYETFRLSFT